MSCLVNYKTAEKPLPFDDLLVEVGFGRGDFIVRLAKENPGRTIFGIELSGISVEKLIRRVKRENLKNVYCTRIDAYWGFYLLFRDNSVERIYMNYPDPWFKKRHAKRRLTRRENLYLFAKKLKEGGEIVIRTDHYPFIEYTLEEAEHIQSFSPKLRNLKVDEPLTKYEKKWLSMGKELYELILKKVKEPKSLKIPEIKEVKELFPVKIADKPNLESLRNREFKLAEEVHLKLFDTYESDKGILLEALLSEEGFVQKFYLVFRKKGEEWILDISPFSQVLRTENLQKVIEFVAKECTKR